jgi:hypothetical protein
VFTGLLLAGVIFYFTRVRGRVDPGWARR